MEAIDKLRELSKKLDDPYFIKEFEEGFEKFLKERDMKIYHTRTLEDYDALMVELEEKGCKWFDGKKPTYLRYWKLGKENTCIDISGKDIITFAPIEWYKKKYPDTPIIEYKAKGANKVEKKCEKCDIEYHDKKANYCSMCGNELAKKPEFTIGDYVTDDSENEPFVCKVEKIEDGDVRGNWYVIKNEYFDARFTSTVKKCRIATPEEIAEYKVALNFHKHGRKPFEVKEGDLIESKSGRNIIVFYPENYSRVSFLKDGWKLLKTAEEVNEWIKGE